MKDLKGKKVTYIGEERLVLEDRGSMLLVVAADGSGPRERIQRAECKGLGGKDDPAPRTAAGTGKKGAAVGDAGVVQQANASKPARITDKPGKDKTPAGTGKVGASVGDASVVGSEGGASTDPLNGNVKEVVATVAGIEDVEELLALQAREEAAEKPRTTVVSAISARLDELEEAAKGTNDETTGKDGGGTDGDNDGGQGEEGDGDSK